MILYTEYIYNHIYDFVILKYRLALDKDISSMLDHIFYGSPIKF
jgi:hypothetical protein